MKRRGGKRTVALNMRNVAPDRGNKSKNLGDVQDGDGHATNMDAGGEVAEAVAKEAKLRLEEIEVVRLFLFFSFRRGAGACGGKTA